MATVGVKGFITNTYHSEQYVALAEEEDNNCITHAGIVQPLYVTVLRVRTTHINTYSLCVPAIDDHGNGIPIPIGNPMGMGIDDTIENGNGKEWESMEWESLWEWEWPLFPWK